MSGAIAQQETSRWLRDHIARIDADPGINCGANGDERARHIIPPIPAGLAPLLPGIDLWDLWPLQLADGSTARFNGWSVWFVLSAPALPDPDARHDIARIRLMTERDGQWRDCGNALPDGLNPGSREWAGTALHVPETGAVTLFYTVAGYPGEQPASFAQRLFQTTGALAMADGAASITGWSIPQESFPADERHYVRVTQATGTPGFIKGFRDPAHFRDPATGETWLLFTASLSGSAHAFNGCIGIARATDAGLSRWQQYPPLISADGLNNEQERPVMIHHAGRYYLFWSTQRKVFAPDGPSGPNGLYGMVADTVLGPYRPLNGTGLVAANPASAPFQSYSWWVETDLTVSGFSDFPAIPQDGVVPTAEWRRAHFGGTPAPLFRVVLEGDTAFVA